MSQSIGSVAVYPYRAADTGRWEWVLAEDLVWEVRGPGVLSWQTLSARSVIARAARAGAALLAPRDAAVAAGLTRRTALAAGLREI
ncbi:hypothetical protein SAMN05216456_1584 [Devosia crocina]|uniref:Uncharacterized protein n=1 Tax=Devosia crocina TaxID=429728 RepID=A0A1I7NCH3_9HYPH|nr:hypothetical protein [Devosia crocina]SFV32246.1 hypothetical protein SAMN05216456_1584 [Devosia crocina]